MPIRIVIWPSFSSIEIFELRYANAGKLAFSFGRSGSAGNWPKNLALKPIQVDPHILDECLTKLLSLSPALGIPPRNDGEDDWMGVADGTRVMIEISGNFSSECTLSWVIGCAPQQWNEVETAVIDITSTLRSAV